MNPTNKEETLKNLGDIIENISKDQINQDYPLLLIMIGLITSDIDRIIRLKNSIEENEFYHYVNKPLTSSPWTIGILFSMGYQEELEQFLSVPLTERSESPTSISETP